MITNERQHRITRAEIKRFEDAIGRARQSGPEADVHPRIYEAMIEGLESQLNDLREEVSQYEALREGRVKRRVLTTLLDLPAALIEGRIARGLTQKELGHRLGVAEQQVQRYEKTRYAGASLERLQEVADAVGISLRKTIEFDVGKPRSVVRGGSRMAASRRTGKAAASAAGKTLASSSASKTAKRAAASDLAQVGNKKVTGSRAASSAGKTLPSKSASKTAKRAAASDLSQAARKRKR